MVLALFATLAWVTPLPADAAVSSCAIASNPIVCENAKAGAPPSEWDIQGSGDPSIQGFTTDISVNRGQAIGFKITTPATGYRLDIYRLGYYQGNGARKVATVTPSAKLPQIQPACLTDASTGLVDCGNWAISATWSVPSTSVSGIYTAHLVRTDTGGSNQIEFIVRDDASTAPVYFQTSDTTWQAYNTYGGASLYTGGPVGRAYKVSYNRPFDTRVTSIDGRSFLFANEYPMLRFLEANGYNTVYGSGVDSDRFGSLLKRHRVFLSVGHDEYWSGAQRANVEAARDAGVNLAFFSGNEVFWKTRWEPSIAAGATAYRTLVTYKETLADAKIDPSPQWTGTWRDPRFSPPADGGRPENRLTGTLWTVNCCGVDLQVPQADGRMRFWRNTAVAALAPGNVATLAPGTLGYEWDEDVDNGSRPPGLVSLSTTTVAAPERLIDYGGATAPGTATHHITLYRAPSGALVMGAGTIQWSWGLDGTHDGASHTTDRSMRQATVNLLADMRVQPGTRQSDLTAASASVDTTAPTTTIASPAPGSTVTGSDAVTISGVATDAGGGVVGAVEVSTDGGATWHPASGRGNWTYSWRPTGTGMVTVKARATDDSGNTQATPASVTVSVSCPCTIFGGRVPTAPDAGDPTTVELGTRFRSDANGWIIGIRFFKGAGNTGTHTGSLWSADGTLLATATFAGESATGWQSVRFPTPVPVTAGATYIASYFAPAGHYAADPLWFWNAGTDAPPLHATRDAPGSPNGVYHVGPGFPTDSYRSMNYWVDPVLVTAPPLDTTPPHVSSTTPPDGTTGVSTLVAPAATFDEAVQPTTVVLTVSDSGGHVVGGATTTDASGRVATFTPSAALAPGTTYTASVSSARDLAGNPLAVPITWSFATSEVSCPCSIFGASVPATPDAGDASPVELGLRVRSDVSGAVTGIRFYKSAANTGTHTGALWSDDGTLLASGTFAGETATGWQTLTFPAPVPLTAGAIYVVGYYAPNGHYAAQLDALTTPVSTGPLHTVGSSTEGPNGVFGFSDGAFPTYSYRSANYWVDLLFLPSS